ncbi:MAG: adenosine deaminase family protein, partial [Solirubrobacterales bacterium]
PAGLIALLIGLFLVGGFASGASANEKGAAQRLQQLKDEPSKLRSFLFGMPKGTDLHTHLSGSVYAESIIKWGAEDGKCVDPVTYVSSFPPCTGTQVPLANALLNTTLFDNIVEAWSMRGFIPGEETGHDHFFATFDLFGGAFSGRTAYGLAEETNRAGSQNVRYTEPLITPQFGHTLGVANQVGYNPDFGELRESLLNAGLLDAIPAASAQASSALSGQQAILDCDGPNRQPGCDVEVRFDVQVLRNQQPVVAFAQLLFGFELMKADPNWAGMNMVQPEDASLSVTYYRLHMKMIQFLKQFYPDEKVTLHAGELVPGLVPPEDLRFHIRQAVNVAGADRIGHGADLKWEKNPQGLLDDIVEKKVCLEINLSSNAQILELKGKAHPIRDYVKNGVRVTLSTDDEGISRTDLTNQYGIAVRQHGYGYRRLKAFAQEGLRCSFLPGSEKKTLLNEQKKLFNQFEAKFKPKKAKKPRN